jgi:hypothetical protein
LPPPPACPSSCSERFWISGEHLLWWVKDEPLPFENASFGAFSGVRMTVGAWIDPASRFGVELSGFTLERRTTSAGIAGILDVPPLVLVNGAASVSVNSQLYGGEISGLFNLCRSDRFHADLLGGFRYLGLQEGLNAYAAGDIIFMGVADTGSAAARVLAQNNFYGGQIGARAGTHFGRWSADVSGKLGIGAMCEGVNVSAVATGPVLGTTGFNRRSSRNEFALVPELEVRVGYNITQHFHAFVAYDLLFLNHVARPGDQNIASYLGTTPTVNSSDFWAQGVSLGLEFTY